MNKKWIAFILILVISITLCACRDISCGGDVPPSTEATERKPTPKPSVPSGSIPPVDDGKVTYTVTVVDEAGNGVAGVTIQFCDAESCRIPVKTNADGKVIQTYAASEYHITLTSIPDGYTSAETEFYFEGKTELTVVLTAASEQ